MKTRKNLMLLVLLSLFLSVGVADSNVTDVNVTGIEEILSAFAEAEELIEKKKKAEESLLAKQEEEKKWTEEEKRSEESLEAAQERERIANLAIAGS